MHACDAEVHCNMGTKDLSVYPQSLVFGHTLPVCKITFETWTDTLSGHDKVCTDISAVVWTLC